MGTGPVTDNNGGRVLGVDPGTIHTGWGIVELHGTSLFHLAHGTITMQPGLTQGLRLSRIYHGLNEVLSRYQPGIISVEKVFFARNAQSALKLGQARGVALLAATESQMEVQEYNSVTIKQAVVGYGHASKLQVQKMVASLLNLSSPLAPDAADALAAAICHLHQDSFHSQVKAADSLTRSRRRHW